MTQTKTESKSQTKKRSTSSGKSPKSTASASTKKSTVKASATTTTKKTSSKAGSKKTTKKSTKPKKTHNKTLGLRGEEAAAMFLERRGYEILERNYTCLAGEADIIAFDEEVIHFVEVKTRMSTEKGFPAEAVNMAKRKRYERIAEFYLKEHYHRINISVTFDIISVLVTSNNHAFIKFHRNVLREDCA